MRLALQLFLTCLPAFCIPVFGDDDDNKSSPQDLEFFEKKVRPLLVERCYSCHSQDSKTLQGGLRVDSLKAMLEGGDSGPALVKKSPDESLLIQAIRFEPDADFQMPPKGRLPEKEIAILTEWIDRGAPYPVESQVSSSRKTINLDQARKFWSFVPAKQHPLPKTKNTGWPKQRIDHFVLAGMEKNGLEPSPEANRSTWLRRVTFDLTGLPPTPAEVSDFLQDDSAEAYEKVVDRLLESPHYGERWGRVWLDLARYTDRNASWLESTGQAHLYRDWIVQAMNDDVPYDEFIHRQLATDLMPETGPEDIAALGFLGLSPNYWKELKLPPDIIKVIVADEWEERIDTVSRSFLGLTVACARCHDHKFDAISMKDYYALAGVIASCRVYARPIVGETAFEPAKKAKEKVAQLEKKRAELAKKKPKPEKELLELATQINELKSTPHYDAPLAPAIRDETLYVELNGKTPQSGTKLVYKKEPRDLPLFVRGNPNRPGETVPRRFLSLFSDQKSFKAFGKNSGRLDLAKAITTDAASLTARVWVNRIWASHFGRGIVTTPSNFGQSGTRPSHPELLDDLAARLIAGGWKAKPLHREIVLSSTYRQTSKSNELQETVDPENRWLSKMNRIRLDVESWRDAMLLVSGELDRKIGGPSISLADTANRRRTIYGTIHRREMSMMLLTHDFPDPTSHSPMRVPTTTALQGLYALNGSMILARSSALADRTIKKQAPSDRERIIDLYQSLFTRPPAEKEIQLGLRFLENSENKSRKDAWTEYAQVLLASNEFLFVL